MHQRPQAVANAGCKRSQNQLRKLATEISSHSVANRLFSCSENAGRPFVSGLKHSLNLFLMDIFKQTQQYLFIQINMSHYSSLIFIKWALCFNFTGNFLAQRKSYILKSTYSKMIRGPTIFQRAKCHVHISNYIRASSIGYFFLFLKKNFVLALNTLLNSYLGNVSKKALQHYPSDYLNHQHNLKSTSHYLFLSNP